MLNCIIDTTLPKSGTKRPSTPASFMRRSVGSGFLSEHSMSRKMRLASGSLRSLSSISRSDRRSSRTALGWKKAPVCSALAKKRMRLTGSRLNTSASATLSRPLSMRKSLLARMRRRVRQLSGLSSWVMPGEGLTCSISSAEHRIVVRSPTSLATRK